MSDFSIERIVSVDKAVLEAAERLASQLESSNQVTITPDYLTRITRSQDNHWLMARRESDARFIGMASLIVMPMPTNIRSSLENVVVDESARNLGVGLALCRKAFEIANEQGVNTLRAAASPDNIASKTMLEKAGFVTDSDLDYYELSIHKGPRF